MGRKRQTKANIISFTKVKSGSVKLMAFKLRQIPREKMLVSFLDELHQERRENYLDDLRQSFCKG